MEQKLMVIVGYAQGLGEALKNTYQNHGYTVISIARSRGDFQADITDYAQTKRVFMEIQEKYKTPDVVIHNISELHRGSFEDLELQSFTDSWKAICKTAIHLSHVCIPMMKKRGGGTLIFSGATASKKGGKNFSAFASAKFALRGLVQSLAREYHPQGIHIVHTILDGIIWSEQSQQRFPTLSKEKCLIPEDIADIYYDLSRQNPSTWTHEIDIRPAVETF